MPIPNLNRQEDGTPSILRKTTVYQDLCFYRKSVDESKKKNQFNIIKTIITMKHFTHFKSSILRGLLSLFFLTAMVSSAWGEDFSKTYSYGLSDWSLNNYTDQSSYYQVPSGNDPAVATISGVFSNKTITSDVVVTINCATYGNGTNPSASTFSLYKETACSNAITASQGGTLPTSATYTNVTYTITQANAASLTGDLAIKITKPGKTIRLKSIKVEFSYTSTGSSSPTKLSTPANLSSSNITPTSATLSWGAVTNASSYKVKIGSTEYNANTNSYSAIGLTAGTQYTWTVKAIGDETSYLSSDYAANSSFTTLAAGMETVILWDEQNWSNITKYSLANGATTTKTYNDAIAGGTSPELLIAKGNGSLTYNNIDLKGATGSLELSWTANGNLDISSNTANVSINSVSKTSDKQRTCIISIPAGTEKLNLTFTNSNASSNVRIDNILLTGQAPANPVKSISIKTPPTKTKYKAGEALNLSGLVLTATYEDETTKDITSGYSANPVNGTILTKDNTSVTLTYKEVSTTQTIEVGTLTSISVSHAPTITDYVEGQTFSTSGMVITGTYSNNLTETISGYTIMPDGALSTADNSITISYNGLSTTQEINVVKKELTRIDITTPASKLTYEAGASFNTTGMVVTAYFNDNSSRVVTNYTVSPDGALSFETTSITISYTEGDVTKSATQDITVKVPTERFIVTFSYNGQETEISETEGNGGVTPIATSSIGRYSFAGWTTTPITEETISAPSFVELNSGKYYPTQNTTLYAVFTHLKDVEIPGMILSTTIEDGVTIKYAGAPSNTNAKTYLSVQDNESSAVPLWLSSEGYLYYINGGYRYYIYNDGNDTYVYKSGNSNDKHTQFPWVKGTSNGKTTLKCGNKYLCYQSQSKRFNTYALTMYTYYELTEKESTVTDKQNIIHYATSITEPIAISSAGYATYVTSNALDFSNCAGIEAFKVKVEGDEVLLKSVSEVPAGTAIVVKGEPGAYNIPAIASTEADFSDNQLTFSEEKKMVDTPNKYYVLAQQEGKVCFAPVAVDSSIGAKKGYIELTGSGAASLRIVIDDLENGNETAIPEIDPTGEIPLIIYTMTGIRIPKVVEDGLYIVNGKTKWMLAE